jgi:arylsulfatase A-like enzyme
VVKERADDPRGLRRTVGLVLLTLVAGGCTPESEHAAEAPVADRSGDTERSGATDGAGDEVRRPNIVLISVDTLRPDHLGCYGYERATSPRMDRLAAEGVLFESAISSTSWTLPAHAALFTGLADSVHGCYETDRRLADDRVTLAERLAGLDYATVGFFAGPYLHPVFGLAQGFGDYVDCTSYADLSLQSIAASGGVEDEDIDRASHRDITNPRVLAAVEDWLGAHEGGPFFMFIHLWDVHFDFVPPPPYDTMFDPDYEGSITSENFIFNDEIHADMAPRDLEHIVALYDGEIAWTDEHIGRIVDLVDGRGEETIIVLLSDHGEEFFEHGAKGHRHALYDELIRIPLIIRFPGHVPAGHRIKAQARMIDVMPTLLEMIDASLEDDVMGQSLLPAMIGESLRGDTLAVSELTTLGRSWRAFRRPHQKVILNLDTKGIALYDLLADPGEQSPLQDFGSTPDLVASLRADTKRGNRWLANYRSANPITVAAPVVPERVARQLRSLGYLGGEAEEGAETEDPPDR